jgi:ABC-type glutathione transport system ATPase component
MTDPKARNARAVDGLTPIIELIDVSQVYDLPRERLFGSRPRLTALHGINLSIGQGEALGIVGESGAGKSTLTRMLVADERPFSGTVRFEGDDLWEGGSGLLQAFRRDVQIVLQNPRSAFDPRMRVGASLREPLRALRIDGDHESRIREVLDQVGLDAGITGRYPHEFSGGQLQRLAIARALLPSPRVLIADEPVSALDVSVQAQILNLLKDLVDRLGLSLILIAHDLSVVAYTTTRVAVVANGSIVEEGEPRRLFAEPQTAETRALVDAVLTIAGGLDGRSLQ